MITSSTERFTCSVYPEPSKLTDAGLNHAWQLTLSKINLSADHVIFQHGFAKSDFIEAMAMLILESEYRWHHLGGKEAHAKIFS